LEGHFNDTTDINRSNWMVNQPPNTTYIIALDDDIIDVPSGDLT
jgi:hypothetical protein